MIPTFIISYYRPESLRRCVESLQDKRLQLIIVSNDGQKFYPKEWYNPIAQMLMSKNCLHTVCWEERLVPVDEPYIVTDCDIVAPKNDWLDILLQGMERLPQYTKFGLGLDTSKAPKKAQEHEKNLHRKPIDSLFEECPVDTTLALYRRGNIKYSLWGNNSPIKFNGQCLSVRTKEPYLAKHLTWEMDEALKEEQKEYKKHIDKRITQWSKTL